jgi:hypothetical protein
MRSRAPAGVPASPVPVRTVRVTTAGTLLAVAVGRVVVVAADGGARDALAVLASCAATAAVPLAVRFRAERAPDADARFARVLASLTLYLLPMAVVQSLFA